MNFKRFEEMPVWRHARALTSAVYSLTCEGAFQRDFGLKDQMRRASVSVMSNIGERYERLSKKEFVTFLGYAKGSVGEVRSQLYVALDQGYITQEVFDSAHQRCIEISVELSRFSSYLKKTCAAAIAVASAILLLCYCGITL
jgi:four helix bundle protein